MGARKNGEQPLMITNNLNLDYFALTKDKENNLCSFINGITSIKKEQISQCEVFCGG